MALKAGRPSGRTGQHIDTMKQDLQREEERRLNVRMPKSEYRRLQQYALDREMSISDVVRQALREWMGQR